MVGKEFKKVLPLGINILSVLNFLAGAIIFISVFALGFFGLAEGGFGLTLTGVLLLLSIIPIFIGIGLRKGKKWARITEIVISIMAIFWALYSMASLALITPEEYLEDLIYSAQNIGVDPSYYNIDLAKQSIKKGLINNILSLIPEGLILWYLGFNKNAKSFFSKTQKA